MGEGGSGFNKHIRFNEKGEEEAQNGPAENGDIKENGHSGVEEEEEKAVPSSPKENGTKEEEGSPTSEKENKDTNGVKPSVVTDSEAVEGDVKGKGKGKGKGKSSSLHSKLSAAADPEPSKDSSAVKAAEVAAPERRRKTAKEIYSSLLNAAAESGDEDSEDSEDEEFGAGTGGTVNCLAETQKSAGRLKYVAQICQRR